MVGEDADALEGKKKKALLQLVTAAGTTIIKFQRHGKILSKSSCGLTKKYFEFKTGHPWGHNLFPRCLEIFRLSINKSCVLGT